MNINLKKKSKKKCDSKSIYENRYRISKAKYFKICGFVTNFSSEICIFILGNTFNINETLITSNVNYLEEF